ncbi:MAG TPA: dUTP diphosphatase [Anaerolineales bacterium]|nr:dUTP diphosphatase [Anaerolineales bacterium]
MTFCVKVKKLIPDAQLPKYGRPGDAGFDLYAAEDMSLAPGKHSLIKTGIAVSIPEGTVGLIWDRSGMAARHGIKTMAGVVDFTYRGEVGVVLINLSQNSYGIKKGDRIAQMLIQPVLHAQVEEVTDLEGTERGASGFGSSGK